MYPRNGTNLDQEPCAIREHQFESVSAWLSHVADPLADAPSAELFHDVHELGVVDTGGAGGHDLPLGDRCSYGS